MVVEVGELVGVAVYSIDSIVGVLVGVLSDSSESPCTCGVFSDGLLNEERARQLANTVSKQSVPMVMRGAAIFMCYQYTVQCKRELTS